MSCISSAKSKLNMLSRRSGTKLVRRHAPNPAKGVARSCKGRSTTDEFWKLQGSATWLFVPVARALDGHSHEMKCNCELHGVAGRFRGRILQTGNMTPTSASKQQQQQRFFVHSAKRSPQWSGLRLHQQGGLCHFGFEARYRWLRDGLS